MAANAKRTGRTGPDMRGFPASPDTILNQEHIGMMVRGSVDVVTGTEVRGWAFAPGRREAVMVQAVLNHEILGEALADMHRPDLAAAGLGDGNSGFEIRLFRPIDPLYVPFLSVKVDGGDAELPRAPMLGFGEFFASLYASHPATGRHRSVYGGLWTDRTDAAALLRGKMAIGQIGAGTAEMVTRLIHDGFAVMEPQVTPSTDAWKNAPADSVGTLLEDVALLSVLRAVLEDNPLAVRVKWAHEGDTELMQPSAGNPSPSPAECLEIIVSMEEEVLIDVVRSSHEMAEFTPSGVSRWASGTASDGLSMARANGLVDRYALPARRIALLGPGALYRIYCTTGAAALRVLCLPNRGAPLSVIFDNARRAMTKSSGVKVWV